MAPGVVVSCQVKNDDIECLFFKNNRSESLRLWLNHELFIVKHKEKYLKPHCGSVVLSTLDFYLYHLPKRI